MQAASKKILETYQDVGEVKEILADKRAAAEAAFATPYQKMVRMAVMAGITADIQLPISRRCGRQTVISNVESNTPAGCFRPAPDVVQRRDVMRRDFKDIEISEE